MTTRSATLSQYDIVSYTIGTDDVYELTLVANARTTATASGATKLVSHGQDTFVNNIKDVNLTKANAQTTTAADAETVFLVATLKADGTVKSTAAYKGFANVPTITLADGETTTMSVFMDAKTNNNPATVVFVLDDAERMSPFPATTRTSSTSRATAATLVLLITLVVPTPMLWVTSMSMTASSTVTPPLLPSRPRARSPRTL